MSIFLDKLNYINESKELIKNAIISKGVEVTDSDSLRSYADKIAMIESGSSVDVFGPKSLNGLCLWLDAEINSRDGVHDESINGMQNLVYSPVYGTTAGNTEKLNGSPIFKDKAITLGGTCFYPNYNISNGVTIELVFKLNSTSVNYATSRLVGWVSGGKGLQIYVADDNTRVTFQSQNSGSTAKQISYYTDFSTKRCYLTYTSVLSMSNSTGMYIDGAKISPLVTSDNASVQMATGINMAIGGVASTSTSSVTGTGTSAGTFASGNVDFSVIRIWNRVLTADEIVEHYLHDYDRFGD